MIPEGFLVQILQELRKAGLVTSTRGSCGGYHLSRPANEVSLADVRRAIEGEESETQAKSPNPLAMALHGVCQALRRGEQRRLGDLSLADIIEQASAPVEPMWYI